MLLSGPSGCFQLAPGVHFHHCRWTSGPTTLTGPLVGTNTIEPGTRYSFAGGGVPGGIWRRISSASTGFSAVVTWPVASTNWRNWALVTSVSSIQKPSTRTRWAGFSSAQPRSESVPIVNSPPGTQTIPGRASGADWTWRTTAYVAPNAT